MQNNTSFFLPGTLRRLIFTHCANEYLHVCQTEYLKNCIIVYLDICRVELYVYSQICPAIHLFAFSPARMVNRRDAVISGIFVSNELGFNSMGVLLSFPCVQTVHNKKWIQRSKAQSRTSLIVMKIQDHDD